MRANYFPETGRVYGFNFPAQPWIEIEPSQRAPLPDKYSYYAVVDGQFTILRDEPDTQQALADARAEILSQIAAIDKWMRDGLETVIGFLLGEIKATDKEWIEYLAARTAKRLERAKLLLKLKQFDD